MDTTIKKGIQLGVGNTCLFEYELQCLKDYRTSDRVKLYVTGFINIKRDSSCKLKGLQRKPFDPNNNI